VTTPGIDPGTVRLVAQRLNHYAIPGPHHMMYSLLIHITLFKLRCEIWWRFDAQSVLLEQSVKSSFHSWFLLICVLILTPDLWAFWVEDILTKTTWKRSFHFWFLFVCVLIFTPGLWGFWVEDVLTNAAWKRSFHFWFLLICVLILTPDLWAFWVEDILTETV
jgi:hypothetical protein